MDITNLIDSVVEKTISDKDILVRRIIESIEQNPVTTDDIIEKGRCEIYPDKDVYYWCDVPVIEFYRPSYKFEKKYDSQLTCVYNLVYKIL